MFEVWQERGMGVYWNQSDTEKLQQGSFALLLTLRVALFLCVLENRTLYMAATDDSQILRCAASAFLSSFDNL